MSSDGLAAVGTCEQRACSGIRLHLIRQEDGEVELLRHLLELAQVEIETLLSLAEFSTTEVVDTEECTDAVDDEQTELTTRELFAERSEEIGLMFAVPGTSDGDVLHSRVRVGTEALRDLDDALWTEGSLGVCYGKNGQLA